MSMTFNQVRLIQETVPEAARLEQMAEECCELSQALLKKARKLRGENYTPKTLKEIDDNIVEEWGDVVLCSIVLDLEASAAEMSNKLDRWVERNSDKLKEVD